MCIYVVSYVWNKYWSILCVDFYQYNRIYSWCLFCRLYLFANYINLFKRSGYIQNWVEILDLAEQCEMDKH